LQVDLNALGPFSTDVVGLQYDWPLANHSERRRLFDEHKVFTQKLLWYAVDCFQDLFRSHLSADFCQISAFACSFELFLRIAV